VSIFYLGTLLNKDPSLSGLGLKYQQVEFSWYEIVGVSLFSVFSSLMLLNKCSIWPL
jgi:hypothetical protein